MIRALIVEDEPIARAHLRRLLEAESDVKIVADCADMPGAVIACQQHQPDLVLLDIGLPGGSGFDFYASLPEERRPAVIVITALEGHAVQAFHYDAVDFLLKPFSRERFHSAIAKAREQIVKPTAAREAKDYLFIKTQGRWVQMKFKDIDLITARGHFACIQAGKETHIVRDAVAAIGAQLPADQFIQINRGTIINIDRVRAIHSKSHGDAIAEMSNGESHIVSRRFRLRLNSLLTNASGGKFSTKTRSTPHQTRSHGLSAD